jgi:metal-responsive CopG/Arc/MetJ family transcriptional regulator
MDHLSIMSIRVDHRTDSAPRVQEILTQNGDIIIGRFGIHDPGEINHGLITLNIRADMGRIRNMADQLEGLDGIKINHMQA